MDWKETTRTIRIPKTVCNEFEERGVDLDIVLPDYCPDITAILKYVMKPTITARHQSGDRYTVDGLVTVRILYLSEDRTTVHCYEATQPFSASFRCAGAVHYFVETKNEYVNCRAISPRRMDIHGAFRVHLCAVDNGEIEVFEDPCKQDVFCQKETVTSAVPMCEYEKNIVVNESINLGVQADNLVYTDITLSSSEHKVLTNKAIVKGILLLKAVYKKESSLHSLMQEIPFSQILDVEGLTDDKICETEICPCEQECVIRQNEAGVSVLEYNGKFNSIIRCSSRESASVVMDAYSVIEPLFCQTASLKLCDQSARQFQRVPFQGTVSVPEGLVGVEDQWCELKSCDMSEQADGKQLSFCVTVCMIGRNAEGHLGYYERTLDYNTVCEDAVTNARLRLIGSSCSVNGNQIRVQLDTELCCEYGENKTMTVVSAVAVDTKRAFNRPAATIRIVYANKGDSLWDIAKTHHSSVEHICAENDLTDKTIRSSMMLMIPMI